MNTFKMDFHVHSDYSADSKAPLNQMVNAAIRKGITHIAFTEHVDYDNDMAVENRQWDFDQEKYFEQMDQLSQKHRSEIQLFRAVELGIQPHLAVRNSKVVSEWAFDFVLASLHTVEGHDLYYKNFFEKHSDSQSVYQYYSDYLCSIQTFENFDVLGHLDLYLRYMPSLKSVVREGYSDVLDALLRYVIDKGKGIEVNAGGYRYGLESNNPSNWIVKRYKELGGEIITLGSDAHSPEFLGYNYESNVELLRASGFRYLTYYKERKPQFVKL